MKPETAQPTDPASLHTTLTTQANSLRATITAAREELTRQPTGQAASSLEVQAIELVRLERAIARHEAGLWDRCERCDTRIREERLQVLPTAVTCGPCAMAGAV